jgi:predicted ATPase/class 3 adenylate cyclase
MATQPTGTVTLLFTDIEGSTRLLQELGRDRYAEALELHRRLLRQAFDGHDGYEVDCEGDAFFVAFASAEDAVAAAAAAQRALAEAAWPGGFQFRVRMGLHTGEPLAASPKYVGIDVHKAARIMAAAHGGQVLLSETTRRLVGRPVVDLGRHRLKDLPTPLRLFQCGSGDFPPLKSRYATNLPSSPSRLIGRRRELDEIKGLLRSGARLLTLTGAGGTGKTRLALHAAGQLVDDYLDGVWLVSLASLADAALVEPAIARVLSVRGDLRDELHGKRLLLVLDNLEQLLDAAPVIADLVAAAPGVDVLATSRERLALSAEHEYAVPTLPLEDAVRLFTERAKQLVPRFEPNERVLEIVGRLDGLPLAVELAAARVKMLTTDQIVERLGRSLDLLTGGGRDAAERQRTLRATLQWSYDLLSLPEQALFARLAVFAGSFDLASAETVGDATLDELAALVDKSLLGRTDDGRFFLLETIRQFAQERLAAAEAVNALLYRYTRYYIRLAEEAEPALRDRRQRATIQLLSLEQPNLRAALDALGADADPTPQARLAAACSYFWFLTGQFREGLARLQQSYARLLELDVPERAGVTNGLALMLFMTGDPGASERYAEEALEASRRHQDVPSMLRAYMSLGAAAAAARGDYRQLQSLVEEQIALAADAEEDWYLAIGLANLAVAERELGNIEHSRESALRAVELFEEIGDREALVGAVCNAAHAELLLGELSAARHRFADALAMLRSQPLPEMTIWCLDGLAAVEARDGDAEQGALLLGAAEALVQATDYRHPETQVELERTRVALDTRLGSEHAASLRRTGAALDLTAAIDLALSQGPRCDSGLQGVGGAAEGDKERISHRRPPGRRVGQTHRGAVADAAPKASGDQRPSLNPNAEGSNP